MSGRYVIYGSIASGGMGSVHLARLIRPGGFARTLAVKRLHGALAADPAFVAMFLDEARMAARVAHPNVVRTVDVVTTDTELLIVMEYVLGESLSRLIHVCSRRQERIPPAVAANLVAGALHGLHAAHEACSEDGTPLNLVHRDVSPQNILVGADGVARVLDFGVAKAMGRTQQTRDGAIKGKLAYIAPEQFSGRASRRSDVYSAGVVLWETLTGRRLFPSDTEAETVSNVLRGGPTPPTQYAPDVGSALEAVVMRALAVREEDRFENARDMALALEDAERVLPPSAIAHWVLQLAGDTITERARLVREVERKTDAPSGPSPVGSAVAVESARNVTMVLPEVEGSTFSAHSSPSPSPSARHLSRRLAVMALCGGGVIAGAVLVANQRHSGGTAPASASAPVEGLSTAVVANPSETSDAMPAASTAPRMASAPSSATTPSEADKPPGRQASPRRARPSVCSPPYREVVVDGHVRRIPKPECL